MQSRGSKVMFVVLLTSAYRRIPCDTKAANLMLKLTDDFFDDVIFDVMFLQLLNQFTLQHLPQL